MIMIKYWKEILGGLMLIAIIVLLAMMRKMSAHNDSYASAIAAAQSETEHFRNKAGEEIARRKAAEVDSKTLMEFYNEELSTIKKKMDIDQKNIRSFISAELQSKFKGTGRVDTVYSIVVGGDTINSKEPVLAVSDSTEWINIKGFVSASKGFVYEIDTYDSIMFVGNLRKEKWYKSKQLFVDGHNANPNSHISGLKSVQVKDFKDKRFGVGPSVQIGLDGKVMVGVSVQYSLIKF
jgi:hypothetical protein